MVMPLSDVNTGFLQTGFRLLKTGFFSVLLAIEIYIFKPN